MENVEKETVEVPAVEAGDRRSSRLIANVSILEAFAGWGPRMESSPRNILRGLN